MDLIRAALASTPVTIERQKNCVIMSFTQKQILRRATNLMLADTGTYCKQEKTNCHCHTYAKTGLGFMVGFGSLPCFREIDNSLSMQVNTVSLCNKRAHFDYQWAHKL